MFNRCVHIYLYLCVCIFCDAVPMYEISALVQKALGAFPKIASLNRENVQNPELSNASEYVFFRSLNAASLQHPFKFSSRIFHSLQHQMPRPHKHRWSPVVPRNWTVCTWGFRVMGVEILESGEFALDRRRVPGFYLGLTRGVVQRAHDWAASKLKDKIARLDETS